MARYRGSGHADRDDHRPGGRDQNRECLHCHEGARSFIESWAHEEDLAALRVGTMSCIESGCHEVVHRVDELDTAPIWEPGRLSTESEEEAEDDE